MIYVPFFYFFLLFIIQYKKRKTFCNIGIIITIYYIISSAFAIIHYFENNIDIELKLLPTLLYCFLLSLVIFPFFKIYTNYDFFLPVKKNNKTIELVSWILIVLCMGYFLYCIKDIIQTLRGNLGELRSLSYIESESIRFPWYIYPSVYAKEFAPILQLLFFYSIIFMKNKKIFNLLLLFSSLVLPISDVLNASRTQVIYWIMTESVLLVFFWRYMSKKNKRFTIILIATAGVFAFIYIAIVTISRFDSNSKNSIISYIGQPYLQFCNVFNHYTYDGKITLERTFPIITKYILGEDFIVREYRAYHTLRIGTQTGVFFTFLGDAMLDFGKIGMVIYSIVLFIIENGYIKHIRHRELKLQHLIVITLLFRIPLLGLFAYMYLTITTSVLIIGSLLFSLLISKIRITIPIKQ